MVRKFRYKDLQFEQLDIFKQIKVIITKFNEFGGGNENVSDHFLCKTSKFQLIPRVKQSKKKIIGRSRTVNILRKNSRNLRFNVEILL